MTKSELEEKKQRMSELETQASPTVSPLPLLHSQPCKTQTSPFALLLLLLLSQRKECVLAGLLSMLPYVASSLDCCCASKVTEFQSHWPPASKGAPAAPQLCLPPPCTPFSTIHRSVCNPTDPSLPAAPPHIPLQPYVTLLPPPAPISTYLLKPPPLPCFPTLFDPL